MTMEAEIAKQVGYRMEVKKDALRQTQQGDVKVTFTIHPQDMPIQLYGDAMGQRFLCVLVPLSDDDSPRVSAPVASSAQAESQAGSKVFATSPSLEGDEAPRKDALPESQPDTPSLKWNEMAYPQRAGIRCSDIVYRDFIFGEYPECARKAFEKSSDPAENAAFILREKCGVKSRSEIKPNSEAGTMFDHIDEQFKMYLRYERQNDNSN